MKSSHLLEEVGEVGDEVPNDLCRATDHESVVSASQLRCSGASHVLPM